MLRRWMGGLLCAAKTLSTAEGLLVGKQQIELTLHAGEWAPGQAKPNVECIAEGRQEYATLVASESDELVLEHSAMAWAAFAWVNRTWLPWERAATCARADAFEGRE